MTVRPYKPHRSLTRHYGISGYPHIRQRLLQDVRSVDDRPFFLSLIISWLYKRRSNKSEFVFTFYMIGIIVFFLCFTLKKFELDLGMALGLFAIFGILRYRTDTIDITHLEVGDVNYARETAKIKITYEVSSQK